MVEIRVYALGAIERIPSSVCWTLLAVFVVGAVVMLCRKGLREGFRASAVLMLAEWVFLMLGVAVIFRDANAGSSYNLVPLWSYFHYAENSYLAEMVAINLLNVAMFVPVGLMLGYGFERMSWGRVLAIGFGLSLTIELLQLVCQRGLCEVDDMIHNMAGCLLGYGITRINVLISNSTKDL